MDKYTEALLQTLKMQREAALDEAAKMSASVVALAIEKDSLSKRLEAAKTVISEAYQLMPLPVAPEGEEPSDDPARKKLADFLATPQKE